MQLLQIPPFFESYVKVLHSLQPGSVAVYIALLCFQLQIVTILGIEAEIKKL